MRATPPDKLVELLGRLRLATPQQIAAAGPRARRLAGELPDFESVWVDALASRRLITPWQAAEINAGRGQRLLWGPYQLVSRLSGPHYAECFAARHVDSGRAVWLFGIARPQRPADTLTAELEALTSHAAGQEPLALLEEYGTAHRALWGVCRACAGSTAAQWMVENGRLPPAAVLQIAREMVRQLVELERLGILHGDLGAAGLLLAEDGSLALPAPGLRGIVRTQEGFGLGDLRPEAYDYLAPERVADGSPPTVASEVFACGALWWHLLTGRPPLAGGNSLAKLRAAQAGRIADVRTLAAPVPDVLAEGIAACLARDPAERPRSLSQLAELLGPPTPAGQLLVASLMKKPVGTWSGLRRPAPRRQRRVRPPAVPIAVGGLAAALAVLAGVVYQGRDIAAPAKALPQASVAKTIEIEEPVATDPPAVKVDHQVRLAAATVSAVEPIVEDLVLPTNEIVSIEQLELQPHMRVRGRGGNRPLVRVPHQGLLVGCEDVCFEGVDFVWQTPGGDAARSSAGAMVVLGCQTIAFRGCSFSARSSAAPVALRVGGARQVLPGLGGEVTLVNCVFDGVAAVVERDAPGGLSVSIDNCLCVASGPLLRLVRYPHRDEPIELTLDHVTTRGDTSVLACDFTRILGEPGPISIEARGCALAGRSPGGQVTFVGASPPEALLKGFTWKGQGSIVTPPVPLAVWRNPNGDSQRIAEEELAVAGLVRGEVEFAGRPDAVPADSRVTRWQVPLRSPDPPGADPAPLYSLRSRLAK